MITALEPQQLAEDLRPHRRAVRQRLAALRGRLRAALAVEGALWVLGCAIVLVAVSLGVDRLLRLSTATRVPLALAGGLLLVFVAYRKLFKALRLSPNELDWAEVLNRRRPGVGESIANVLQLPGLIDRGVHASPSMVYATVTRQASELERVDLAGLMDSPRQRKFALALAVLAAASVAMALLWPEVAGLWARRWLLGSSVRWPQHNYVSLLGLNDGKPIMAPRGESLVLEVNAQPHFKRVPRGWLLTGRGEPLFVEGAAEPRSEIPSQVAIRYRGRGGDARQGNFTHFNRGTFRYELPPLSEPLDLTITAGDDWLGPVHVQPIDRPTVESLTIVALQPGSAKPQVFRAGDAETQLLFLPKTKLELRIASRHDLENAELVSKDGPMPLARLGKREYIAKWEMQEALTLELTLVGRLGHLSSKPYFLTIGVLIDREPRVMVRSSGVGRRVTPQAKIPLALRVLDDFGITSVNLQAERTGIVQEKLKTTLAEIDLGAPDARTGGGATEFEQSHIFQVSQQKPAVGDVLKLRASASDNFVLGKHTGYSRWLTFQIVTPEELFYEILTRQREQRARFAAALQSSKGLSQALARLAKPEDTSGLLRTHQVVSRQVWQIANQIDASLEEMKLNDLGTLQTRDLLATSIIAPMRQLHGKKLSAVRAQLDALATSRSIEPAPRAEAEKLQQDVVDTMQRILERMAQWESFVDVVNQLRAIYKLQGEVLKSTEETRKERTNDLFDE